MAENEQFVEFLRRNKSRLIWGVAFAVLIAVALARFAGGHQSKKELAYLDADNRFEAVIHGEETIGSLERILHKHNELYAKYDGDLAQYGLQTNDLDSARKHAGRVFDRTHSHAALYTEFSHATLAIAEGQYEEALTQSIDLQEQIGDSCPVLAAHNLLRIALLQQELASSDEPASWERLLSALDSERVASAFGVAFMQNGISLRDYAQNRLNSFGLQ